MVRILVLGPSAWRDTHDRTPNHDPLTRRTQIRDQFSAQGHDAFLLEDLSGPTRPLRHKFLEAVQGVSDVVVYWPPQAKMVTTQQELTILPELNPLPRVWILAHKSVANMDQGFFELTEHGDRGRYTDDIIEVAHAFIPWTTSTELDRIATLVSETIHAETNNE